MLPTLSARAVGNAMAMQLALVSDACVEVAGGWRMAVCVDGEPPAMWLCRHVHATAADAQHCLAASGCTCSSHPFPETVDWCLRKRGIDPMSISHPNDPRRKT